MKIFLTGANGMVGKNIINDSNSKKYEWLTPTSEDLIFLI